MKRGLPNLFLALSLSFGFANTPLGASIRDCKTLLSLVEKGLIIKSPHIDNILAEKKTWEIRSSSTKIRGEIALIKSASGLVLGTVDIVDSIGPLSTEDLLRSVDKHLVSAEFIRKGLGYKKAYAWVLSNPRLFEKPVPYVHPQGAVIWVQLKLK